MARRTGILHAMAETQRAVERERKARERQLIQAQREADREKREKERAKRAAEKERRQIYLEIREMETVERNEDLAAGIAALEGILTHTLSIDDALNFNTLRVTPQIPPFNPGPLNVIEQPPLRESFLPSEPSMWRKLLPGTMARYEQELAEGQRRFQQELEMYQRREQRRKEELATAKADYSRQIARAETEAAAKNAEVDKFQREYSEGDPQAVVDYCTYVLEASIYPDTFPQHSKIAYVPESKQLVVEADLPSFDVIPAATSYKYNKTKDEITATARPLTQRRALYNSVIAQVAVRTLHGLFEADRSGHIDTIVYNGYVDSVDRGTGQHVRPCLVTIRTTRDVFGTFNLAQVDPVACLQRLNASLSKSPAELAPVRPVIEFSMVDPRFIEETDVLSGLDQRPNLMELSPSEFESLISNLFGKMGLETRLTQASRDGGVDCVAYDPRPIFGGKVVIQAKRYKHTVGVSAVRDLFGTVQNEGASKGILVTTSGYGKAAFDFASGKPLELLDGSHLLHLLAEHAGIEARILMPDDWRDPVPDRPE